MKIFTFFPRVMFGVFALFFVAQFAEAQVSVGVYSGKTIDNSKVISLNPTFKSSDNAANSNRTFTGIIDDSMLSGEDLTDYTIWLTSPVSSLSELPSDSTRISQTNGRAFTGSQSADGQTVVSFIANAGPATNQRFTFHIVHKSAATHVRNFAATPGSVAGSVDFTWDLPLIDGFTGAGGERPVNDANAVNGYRICVGRTKADADGNTNCQGDVATYNVRNGDDNPTEATVTGLATNGRNYYAAIRFIFDDNINNSGTFPPDADTIGPFSAATMTVVNPPAMPTGVTASAGDASIEVSWDAVSGADSYNVCAVGGATAADADFADIDTTACTPTTGNTVNVSGTSATLTTDNAGIANGMFYAVGVFAVNTGGTSAAGGTGEDPVQPIAFTATFSDITVPAGGGVVDLTEAVTHNAEVVYPGNWILAPAYDHNIPDTITVSPDGTTPEITIKSETDRSNPDFTYSVQVSLTVSQKVPFLDLIRETITITGTGATPPDAPTAVTVKDPVASGFTVEWTAPATAPTSYEVCILVSTVTVFNDTNCVFGENTRGFITTTSTMFSDSNGLDAGTIDDGTVYRVAVRSINGSGTTALSSAWTEAATTIRAGPLPPPTSVSNEAGPLSVIVKWTAPTDAPDGYHICVRDTAVHSGGRDADCVDANNNIHTLAGGTATTFTVLEDTLSGAPLMIDRSVVADVRAYSGSEVSAWASPTSPVTIIAADVALPLQPSITLTAAAGAISVSWTTASGNPQPDSYEVCVAAVADIANAAALRVACRDRTAEVSIEEADISPHSIAADSGTVYRVAVRSLHDLGNSVWVVADDTVTPTALPAPDAPSGVSASAGDAEIVVTWDAPSGTTPTGYTICAQPSAAGASAITDAACGANFTVTIDDYTAGDDTRVVLSDDNLTAGISNGQAYSIGVRADHSSAGNSAWGTAEPVTPVAVVPPGAPTNVMSTGIVTGGSWTVSWTAPVGEPAATGYEVCMDSVATGGTNFDIGCTPNRIAAVAGAVTSATLSDADFRFAAALELINFAVRATVGDAKSAWTGAAANPIALRLPTADATLSDLSLTDIPITFATDTTSYTPADVGNDIDTTTVTATPSDDNATVAITSDRDSTIGANGEVDLAVGANAITITVTAEDTTTTATYTVTVNRAAPSSDATLSALTMAGNAPVVLSPVFVSDTHTYTATVVNSESQIGITATPTDSAATPDIAVDTDADAALTRVDLAQGDNVITITVTAADGTTTQPYVITVTREADTTTPTPPRLSITTATTTVTEGTDAMVSFTVTSTPAPLADLSVTVTLGGGDAYVSATTQTVTIAADTTMATVHFAIVDDDNDETDATVTATIGDSDAYTGDGDFATARILDDDLPPADQPDAFEFNAPSGVIEPGDTVTSNAITVSGLTANTPMVSASVSGGMISINGAAATTSGMVGNTHTVTVTVTAGECGERVTATVNLGGTTGDFRVATRACRMDASLATLTIAPSPLSLSPSFDSAITSYNVKTPNDFSGDITVTATATDTATATVTGDGTVMLTGNSETVRITVTAEDRSRQTYTISINRDQLPMITARTTSVKVGGEVNLNTLGDDPDDTETYMVTPATLEYGRVTGDNRNPIYEAPTAEELAALPAESTLEFPLEVVLTLTVISDNTGSAEAPITIQINDATELTPAAMESLPAATRAITGQISDAISGRINAAVGDSVGGINLASLHDESVVANFLANNEMNAKQILANNDFVLPLNAGGGGGLSSLSFWASGGIGGINGDENTADWDGDYNTANLGLDAKVRDDLLIGAALSLTQSEIDYKDSAEPDEDGKYELNLTTLHPYFAWQGARNSLWGSIGGGDGEIEITEDGGDKEEPIDAKLVTLTVGFDAALTATTKVKTEFAQSELSVDDETDTKIKTKTAKLALASDLSLSETLTGNIAFGITGNGGDGNTDTAFELTTGVTGNTDRLQLSGELQLRDNARQWGISGSVRVVAGSDGQGLSLTMQPEYSVAGMELTTQLAYGIGKVTPYLNATTNKNEYGVQWQPAKEVSMKLLNEQTESDKAIKLTTEINF